MKKNIKGIIKKAFYFLSRFSKNNQLKLIYYHDVVSHSGYSYMKITTEKFYNQMKYLQDNQYITLNFNDLDKKEYNSMNKNVLLTFDDGWLSNYEVVYPIMKELDLKFNIFLEVGAIGKKRII